VKIQNLTSGLVATLVLASPIAGAEDYPAANFQPTVIYSDVDAASQSSSSTNSKAETSQPDANYPAANFQPTVVYSDTNYKHQQSKASAKMTVTSSADKPEKLENEDSATLEDEESMVTLFGLLVLAAVGFILLKRKSSSVPEESARSVQTTSRIKVTSRSSNTGVTGVARYLSKNMPELSTVAKYLQNKDKIPISGVSKYVAKKVVAAKAAAVAKRTGVEKYLRDRG